MRVLNRGLLGLNFVKNLEPNIGFFFEVSVKGGL
jgi:hypothetical protein